MGLFARLGWGAASRPRLVAGATVMVLVGAAGAIPLMARPGYELALATGLCCPSVAAVLSAVEVGTGRPRQPLAAFHRALYNGMGLALLAYLVAFCHGLRAGFCDVQSGTRVMLLGPLAGMVMASLWGAVAGEAARRVAPRRRRCAAVGLGLAGPLGSITLGLGLFYATPVVFAYDPFVGFFSGSLYDTILDTSGLLAYRMASLATLLALYVAVLHLERDETGRLRRRSPGRPGLVALGALAGAGSLGSVIAGQELGLWSTASGIARQLGGSLVAGRCLVHHDRTIAVEHAWRLARDCDAHIGSLGGWLGLEQVAPVTVYLFADEAQKQRLIGAARVSVAKPWRREIYLQDAGYPHPVLRHELAHALAADLGRGPFAVAGRWGGWLPDPGLIEGLAVAAAPPDDDLDSDEWAAAMRRIDVLPRTTELFALGFFAAASSTSYTAAGSFVGHVRTRFGAAAVARWYGGQPLEEVTGESWEALERGWWAALDRVVLGGQALAEARLRFDRPGLLGRRCPHVVDALLSEAAGREDFDARGALQRYRRTQALDPGSLPALLGAATCLDRLGRPTDAAETLSSVTGRADLSFASRMVALEQLGDRALRDGNAALARILYQQARTGSADEDRLRSLDLKQRYADEPLGRRALVALLIGSGNRGPDRIEALDLIGLWRAAAPDDGTADYLMARQHIARQDYALAADRLDQALTKGLALARVHAEALRLRIRAACALGDTAGAGHTLLRYQAIPGVSATRRRAAAALVQRCTERPVAPPTPSG